MSVYLLLTNKQTGQPLLFPTEAICFIEGIEDGGCLIGAGTFIKQVAEEGPAIVKALSKDDPYYNKVIPIVEEAIPDLDFGDTLDSGLPVEDLL